MSWTADHSHSDRNSSAWLMDEPIFSIFAEISQAAGRPTSVTLASDVPAQGGDALPSPASTGEAQCPPQQQSESNSVAMQVTNCSPDESDHDSVSTVVDTVPDVAVADPEHTSPAASRTELPPEAVVAAAILPVWESQATDVPSLADEGPSFGSYDDVMGRMNGSVSSGLSEAEMAAERRRRMARHRCRVDRSRSKERNAVSSSSVVSCNILPLQANTVGEAFWQILVGRPRHERAALVNMQSERTSFDAALRLCRSRLAVIVRANVGFYIGITEDPRRRFAEHCERMEWERMTILVQAASSSTTGSLEKALLADFGQSYMCLNIGRGGERASGGSPHFLYVLLAREGPLRRPPR